jgi:signal transduction histidine kinase
VPPATAPVAPAATDALAAAVVAAATHAPDGSPVPGDAMLQQLLQAAVDQVGATYGALGVLTTDGCRLDRFVVVGMDATDQERIGRLPTGEGVLGAFLEEPTVLRLDDLADHPASVGFPPGHPAMRTFLGVPVSVGDTLFGGLYLTEKRGGGPFTEADADNARALAAVAGLAIANARHVERAERQRTWLQATVDISTALLSDADPGTVLHSVVRQVTTLTGADLGALLVPTPDDCTTLTIVAAVGGAAADFEGVRVPVTGTTTGQVHTTGRPLAMASWDPAEHSPAAVAVEMGRRYGPRLLVPLNPGEPAGVVFAAREVGRPPFDPELLDLLAGFATQVEVALRLSRSQDRARRLQLQADRDRIARDLHDHVVQRIFATALSLDRLRRGMARTEPEAAERLSRSVDELDQTIAEIRAAIFELHEDDDVRPASLRRQLADVVRQVTEGRPLRRDVRLRGQVDELPAGLVTDLLAVVRELATNVVRHAGASRITVTLTADDEVRVVVTDDGRGLHPSSVRSGLTNLAERAERRGGRLAVQSRHGGTQVRWSVPRP